MLPRLKLTGKASVRKGVPGTALSVLVPPSSHLDALTFCFRIPTLEAPIDLCCRFVKNLSPDKIKLSVFRGEGDLTNLELDEEALMELLDLPTWLCIRKVTCNKVAIKVSRSCS